MRGYLLQGVEDEVILVVRSNDCEELLRVVRRMMDSRDKQIKEMGRQLEKDYNDSIRRRSITKIKSKSAGKTHRGSGTNPR